MKPTLIYPAGKKSKKRVQVAEALQDLAKDISSHRAELVKLARQAEGSSAAGAYKAEAESLECYVVMLEVIVVQMQPESWKWKPERMSSLIERAARHKLTLPAWMVDHGPDRRMDTGKPIRWHIKQKSGAGKLEAVQNG